MKAKDIVAEIAKSSEYHKLLELWNLKDDDSKCLSFEIIEIIQTLDERTNQKKKSFLRSSGLKSCKSHANIIDFRVPHDVQTAKDEFDKELNEQMTVFVQLMNLIPAENLVLESIAI